MARNSRASQADEMERIRRAVGGDDDGETIIDMRIDVEFGDETILSVGGRWDRQLGDFDPAIVTDGISMGDPFGATEAVVLRPHPGQVEAVRWLARWLAVHVVRREYPALNFDLETEDVTPDDEVYSAMLAGGRRAGKTKFGAWACAIYAVMFPGAIVFLVSPNDNKHDEVRRYISEILRSEWVVSNTEHQWELINGSVLALKSAYVGADPDAIKEGEANLIWLNEGQKMAERVFIVARGAVVDRSGLVLVCANPPVQAKDQQWVADFAAEARAGRRAAKYLHLNPLDNPKIDRRGLLAMRKELDLRTFRIEVLGDFLNAVDAVAYNWSRIDNERTAPRAGSSMWSPLDPRWKGVDREWMDVTSEFLESTEEGEGFLDLVGLDVQVHPHIGGPVYRFYVKPGERPTRDNVVAWIVDEVVLEGGDEVDFCRLLEKKGYRPETTLIVCDATAEYQHSRRRAVDSPPPEWTGKGSFDIIRGEGYMHIVPPSKRFRRKNPEIIDRVRAFTSLIENSEHVRRLFADRDRAPMTCKSIQGWKTKNGKPSRIMEEAHLGDAASYPIVRLFPRILRSDKPGVVDPIAQRVDRPEQTPLARTLPSSPSRAARRPRDQGL